MKTKNKKQKKSIFQLIQEKSRVVAGMLAAISATTIIGGASYKENENIDKTKESKNHLGYYDNYNFKEVPDVLEKVIIEDFNNNDLGFSQVQKLDKNTIDNRKLDISKITYSKKDLTNSDVVVIITANQEIEALDGWTLSEDRKSLIKIFNENYSGFVTVNSILGETVQTNIEITNIDKMFKDVMVSYKNLDNGDVKVTISSNEALQSIEGWNLSLDMKSLTKIYTANKTEYVTVKDLAGNSQKVLISVNNVLKHTNENNKDEYSTFNPGMDDIIVPPVEHIHEWGEWKVLTVPTCTTDGEEVRTCQDGHIETRIIKAIGHNLNTIVNEDGSTVTTCLNGCGYYEKTDALEHIHEWGEWKVLTAPTCTNDGEEVRTCQDGHIETRIIKAIGHNLNTIVNEDGSTVTTCLNGCGFYEKTDAPTPPEPIIIDMSSLSIDVNSFLYDGQMHLPVLSNLPDGVVARFVFMDKNGNEIENVTDAGEYICRILFDTPEGYKAESIDIDYTILPVTVKCSYEYNEETGEINAVYSGIVEDDVTSITHVVNGKEITDGAPVLDEFGLHKIESNIEINPDKTGNYVFEDSSDAFYEVKRENNWFKIETDYKEVDGKITVGVYLADDKVPYYSDYISPTFGFKVYFDKSALHFEDGVVNDDLFDGSVYIPNEGEEKEDPESKDVVILAKDFGLDAPVTDRVKVCDLAFTYQDGHENDKNLIIKIDDIEMSTGHFDYDFQFTTDSSSCVINSSSEIKSVTKENDLMDDATYTYEGIEGFEEDEEDAKKMLQDYIDDGFEVPDDLKYIMGEDLDDANNLNEYDELIISEETEFIENGYVQSEEMTFIESVYEQQDEMNLVETNYDQLEECGPKLSLKIHH